MLHNSFLHFPDIVGQVIQTAVEGVGKSLIRSTTHILPHTHSGLVMWLRGGGTSCCFNYSLTEGSHMVEFSGCHCERLHTTLKGQLHGQGVRCTMMCIVILKNIWTGMRQWSENLLELNERVVFLCVESHCPQWYRIQSSSQLPTVPWVSEGGDRNENVLFIQMTIFHSP